MPVQQVPPHEFFPSGDSRALGEVRFDPNELSVRYGLTFEERLDDLDWFSLAAIALPGGSQAWFVKYRGEQEPGTTIYVDAAADVSEAMASLTRALGLADDDFLWVTSTNEASAARA